MPNPITDHPLITISVACAAVASATWGVFHNVIENPLKNQIERLNEIIIKDNGVAKPFRILQNDSTTITLQNAGSSHDFIFSSIIDRNDVISVNIEIKGISSDSCKIDKKSSLNCDKNIKISTGIYYAAGSFHFDELRGVIRFSGSIILSGIAQANYLNTPILSAYVFN